MTEVAVEFLGKVTPVPADRPFTIGRAGDLVIDDNPRLHRRFLVISQSDGMWWLANVGTQHAVRLTTDGALAQTRLAPGGATPIGNGRYRVEFTVGPTTYVFSILASGIRGLPEAAYTDLDGTKTHVVAASLSDHQRLVVLALAQGALAGEPPDRARIPSTRTIMSQLGWTNRAFERALDEVCKKLTLAGVPGLVGTDGQPAQDRRRRLVEYAVTTRMVSADELAELGAPTHRESGR